MSTPTVQDTRSEARALANYLTLTRRASMTAEDLAALADWENDGGAS